MEIWPVGKQKTLAKTEFKEVWEKGAKAAQCKWVSYKAVSYMDNL